MKKISGNKLLVKALREEGVDTLFGYPGACTIDISDELYKQDYTKVILPRQEVALVHEADAYARSTGKVGVCLVTSGPGATNLVTGLATAYYDSVPLVCFIVHLYIFLSLAHKSPTTYPVLAFQSSMTIRYPLISCQLAISAVNVVEV